VALVVAPLAANLRAGLAEGQPATSTAAASATPVADFVSFDPESDQSSLPWPSAAEIEQYAAAEQEARWERFVASLPPEPAPAPAPSPAPPTPEAPDAGGELAPEAPAAPGVPSDSVWDALAQCESSGNWAMNSGNGFYGGIQFMHSTWVNMGGRQWAEYPHQATREQQIEVATRLQAQYGWGQWPACSARLGLR